MAKRKKRAEADKSPTRKEVRIRARDRERNRRLYIGVGLAIGLALVVILAGAVYQYAVIPNRVIASVGSDQIITRNFWKRIHFEKWQMENQLAQMQQLQSQFGQNFFASQISQLQNTLASPFALGVQVLDKMIDEKVIEQQAAARGITVSEDEIATALREEVANGRGAVTESQATATVEAGNNATATAAGWTPTPAPTLDVSSTITATATTAPTPAPPPTRPIISDTGYTEGLNTLTENLTTAGGLTLDEYRQIIRIRLLTDKLQKQVADETVSTTEEQVHARHILIAIRQPTPAPTDTLTTTTTSGITAPITAAMPITNLGGVDATAGVTSSAPVTTGASNALTATEAISAPTSLTGTEGLTATAGLTSTPALSGTLPNGTPPTAGSTAPRSDAEALALAQEIRQRLLAGEDFATLAAEYSDDPGSASKGGDLGWFGRGRMVAPFDEAAFSLPLNVVSEPIKTDYGYHLIEVLEKASDRPKDPQQLQQERQQAFQNWLNDQKTAADIKRPDDLASLLPTDLQAQQSQ